MPESKQTLEGGQVIVGVHPKGDCVGERCTIHNRSEHHMRSFPQNWRGDRGLMERVCPHGVGHPDPDDILQDTIHGCCQERCCRA